MASDAARLALPTAGFDPRVRGLVGLRTWLHVGMPDQKLVSASIQGYDLRAVARPIAVEVRLDGVKQPMRRLPVEARPPMPSARSCSHEPAFITSRCG